MVLLEWNHEDLFLQLHRLIEEQHASFFPVLTINTVCYCSFPTNNILVILRF